MAGIGFSLRKLFDQKGIFNLCKAYGYAGIITCGPMLLGIALLVGMSIVARIGGLNAHDRELLNCMLTYSLLASLFVTGWFNMGVTRFISDMIYDENTDKIVPSFYGCTSIMMVICLVGYGVFLYFSGVRFTYQLACMLFALVLVVVWTQMNYLTALKDYKALALSFAIALMAGFLIALIFILLGYVTIEAMMISMIISYGILACKYMSCILDYFPTREGSNFSFLRWMDRYRTLVISGGVLNIGLFSHLIIMYFGPLRVQVEGLFYGAPQYDVPALIAFFSLLVTTVGFVTSVEVKFYPKYANYYGLFNDKGAIKDIKEAEKNMLTVLRQELIYGGHKQLFTTILFIIVVTPIIETLPLGMTSLSIGIFRFLCVGYGTYAIANSTMLILLYFEDYRGALTGTITFAVISTVCTIYQILYMKTVYFGIGFFAGSFVFYIFTVVRLNWYTKKLPYFLLARQNIIPKKESGPLVYIAEKLDTRWENRVVKAEEEKNRKARKVLFKWRQGNKEIS